MRFIFGLHSFGHRVGGLTNLFHEPDTGGGGGAGDPDGEGGDPEEGKTDKDEKKYSDKDMQGVVEKRLTKIKKELAARDAENGNLKAQVADVTAKMEAITANGDLDADAKKRLGTLEVERKRIDAQLAELTDKNKQLAEKAEQETNRRRDAERSQLLSSALSKVGCIDPDTAKIIFKDRCEFDEEEEQWFFRTANGNQVDIEKGINAELPDYLRPASQRGGSGVTGTAQRKGGAKKKDALLQQKAECQRRLSNKPGDNILIGQIRAINAELKQLESQT